MERTDVLELMATLELYGMLALGTALERVGTRSKRRRLALPSGEFRQYIDASQRYLGLLDLSTRSLSLSRLRRRRSCRIPPGNCGRVAPISDGHKKQVLIRG
jgi:hypothetical protein